MRLLAIWNLGEDLISSLTITWHSSLQNWNWRNTFCCLEATDGTYIAAWAEQYTKSTLFRWPRAASTNSTAGDDYSITASQVCMLTIGLVSVHNMKNLHQLFQNKCIPSTIRTLKDSQETVCKAHMEHTMSGAWRAKEGKRWAKNPIARADCLSLLPY